MNITIKYEIDNTSITDFAALEEEMYQMSLAAGREAMRQALELRDQILMATRDTERYRNKGPRATSIKTKLGVVEYERRVYVDLEAEGQTSCYLLDKDLHIDRIGQVSSSVCEIIAGAICTGSYRTVSHQLTKMTGCARDVPGGSKSRAGSDERGYGRSRDADPVRRSRRDLPGASGRIQKTPREEQRDEGRHRL